MEILSLVQLPIILCSQDSNTLLFGRSVAAADPSLFPLWVLRGSDAFYQADFYSCLMFSCVSGGFAGDGHFVSSGQQTAGEVQDAGWNR